MLFNDSQCNTVCCLACRLLFVTVPITTKTGFLKSLEMCGKQFPRKPSPFTISRTHHHHLNQCLGPRDCPLFVPEPQLTFKLHAEYVITCGNGLLCVILAVTARTRGRDVPCSSSHFCHVCCGDKQEGIFNRRHFLCWSGKAQGWWPCRHSANPICFPRRWRVFKQCRWWHFFCFYSLGQFILLFLNWVCATFYFPVNCPWHFERFYTTKSQQPCRWNAHNVQL